MVFTFVALAYILALILSTVLIFFAVWHVVNFDELHNDYSNPVEVCQTLNPMILPEYGIHLFICLLFLFGGEWLTLILNLPLAVYHINKFLKRSVISKYGIYDPTTIMNSQVLKAIQREGWIKLCFYLISFLYYVCFMIVELIR